MSDCRCSVVAVFAFVLFAFALASASITGSISGVVLDKSGAVVAGATVVATDTLTGVQTTPQALSADIRQAWQSYGSLTSTKETPRVTA